MDRTLAMPDNFLLHVHQEIQIEASPAVVFDAILEQIGPGGTSGDGKPMPMRLEAWPGGRWFRDLVLQLRVDVLARAASRLSRFEALSRLRLLIPGDQNQAIGIKRQL
jgi:hypothetical protein